MARTRYSGPPFHPLTVQEVLQIRKRLANSALGNEDFGSSNPLDVGRLISAVE